MFWKKKSKSDKAETLVFEIAESIFKNNAYIEEAASLAQEKSKEFSVSDLERFRDLFHNPPKESVHYDAHKHGLGGWLSTCQFVIFEILFNMGAKAIPFIREIAWGEYDWTQGNAIELLIRFAANGVQRKEIIAEIKRNYPVIRYEAQLYAIQPLIPKLQGNSSLRAVFDELLDIEDFKESYDELVGD